VVCERQTERSDGRSEYPRRLHPIVRLLFFQAKPYQQYRQDYAADDLNQLDNALLFELRRYPLPKSGLKPLGAK
jgi:hypothetical protein